MSEKVLEWRVPDEADHQRLDRFLAARLEDRTRSALKRWIGEGRVRVDGEPSTKAGLALRAGARVSLVPPPPASTTPLPQTLPLDVVYEDDHLLVIDKAPGMVVHPGSGRESGTVVNALLGAGVTLSSVGAPDRPGIVHRLDRETSGLLIVAKRDDAHHALSRAFAERQVGKTYHALVWGRPTPEADTIDRPIGRHPVDRVRMAVRPREGRPARTDYRTIESLPGFGLLELELHTGRTHQIRVHLQSIGHPLVGDERYGGAGHRGVIDPRRRAALKAFGRLALHASRLVFRHPAEDRELEVRAPLPEDFKRLLEALRGDR